jgi:hypothetical protein
MSIALHIIRMPLASIAAIALSGAAAAQTVAGPPPGAAPPPERHSLTIGIGGGIGPDYEGSNETSFQPGGVVQGQLDGFDFQVRGTNLYIDLLRDAPRARAALTFGPVVQVRLERTGRIRDPRVAALGDRKTAVEVGFTAGIGKRGVLIPPASLNFDVTFLHDVAGRTKAMSSRPHCRSTPRFRAAALRGWGFLRTSSARAMRRPISMSPRQCPASLRHQRGRPQKRWARRCFIPTIWAARRARAGDCLPWPITNG